MAYERQSTNSQIKGDSLDSFVAASMQQFKNQLAIRNAEDELKFTTAVVENDMSLTEQLSYRQDQLKRVSDDPDERRRVRAEIAGLKDRIQQKSFTDEFTQKLVDQAAGISSVDSVLSWLRDQRSATSDINLQAKIDASILDKTNEKFKLTQNLLNDQTSFALKDKSDDVLTKQIARVTTERNKALLAGDDTLTQNYDLQLMSLNKAKTENNIQNDLKNLAVATVTGSHTSVNLLDSYNNKISNSDTTAPITLDGVTYKNEREYWTYKRDSYLADSSGSGFFNRVADEQTTALQVKASNNTITADDLARSSSMYNTLYGRPELAGFTAKIDSAKQDTLQTGANALGDKIVNAYTNTLDLNRAVSDLNTLKAQGVNVDVPMQKVLNSASNLKAQNVSDIVGAAQNLLASNPGMSVADAVNQAVAKGAGVVLSPNQLLGSESTTVATDVIGGGEAGKIGPDGRTTIAPANQTEKTQPGQSLPGGTPPPSAPGATTTPAATTPGAAPAGSSYTIQAGDTLSAIASKHGTTVQALASANGISDPNKIQAGASLKIPTAPVAAATPTPTPAAPTPQPTAPGQPAQPAAPAPAPAAPAAAPTPTTPKPVYNGSSIVDYISSTGGDASFGARSKLAKEKGIVDYTGSASQNTQLLKTLRGF